MESGNRATVLFVDDEPRVLRALSSVFKRRYNVLLAQSAVDAMTLLRNNPVDVVISDERMPRIRGHELLSAVRRKWPSIMSILMTGFADETAIREGINQAEIFRYVHKPWCSEELNTVIAEAVACAQVRKVHGSAQTKPVDQPPILVVDRDPKMEQLVQSTAHELGNACVCAGSVSEALEVLIAQPGIGVVIVDTALGGNDAARAIGLLRSRRPELVVVIATAVCDGRMAIELTNSGQIFRYLVKPLYHDSLKATIEEARQRHQDLLNAPELARTYAGEESDWQPDIKSVWGRLSDIGSRILGQRSTTGH